MDEKLIPMDDEFPEEETAQYIKSFMFINGFAMGVGCHKHKKHSI